MKNIYLFLKAFVHTLISGVVSVATSASVCIVGFASLVYLNQINPIVETLLIFLFVSVFITSVVLGGLIAEQFLKK